MQIISLSISYYHFPWLQFIGKAIGDLKKASAVFLYEKKSSLFVSEFT